MLRRLVTAILAAVAAIAGVVALAHRGRGAVTPRAEAGGILIGDVSSYDRLSRLLFSSFFKPVAADIAAAAPPGAKVLEVGCGPGLLSTRLAGEHGLDVTGLDLDPAMIERATANAARSLGNREDRPSFVVGDVAALPFADASFDLVVCTFAIHHWADPAAGLTEIRRVLRPDGRLLAWDFRPGSQLFHGHMADPAEHAHGTPLRLISARPWRWPFFISFCQRMEFAPAEPGA
jgi:SAM-dependent methyltransferase